MLRCNLLVVVTTKKETWCLNLPVDSLEKSLSPKLITCSTWMILPLKLINFGLTCKLVKSLWTRLFPLSILIRSRLESTHNTTLSFLITIKIQWHYLIQDTPSKPLRWSTLRNLIQTPRSPSAQRLHRSPTRFLTANNWPNLVITRSKLFWPTLRKRPVLLLS
jgi:hypothetical protein